MKPLAFIGLLLALVLVSPIFAASDNSLGGSIDKTHAEVARGTLEKFEISVFSLKNQTLDVVAAAGQVDDLQVNIIPGTLTLQGGLTSTPSAGQKWIIIDGDKYAKAYPIMVYVRVPQQVSRNKYSIPITLSSTVSSSTDSGNVVVQKVVQVLQYNLEIDVPGTTQATKNVTQSQEQAADSVDPEAPAYNIPVFGQIREPISNFLGSNEANPPIIQNKTPESKSPSDAKQPPSGYLILNNENKGSVNYLLIIGAIVLLALIIYLIKK